ncbi:MAG: GNAT family N-acetyltransferase [Thermoguttaceae bacterium]|nr:GNAT family N-acetyltransferase [Thermoguttaceae bacterium]MDW8077305.1 GNAT family N-acetyltransferase [Thermoguttaceae bacterium]
MTGKVIAQSARITLREFTWADFPELLPILTDPLVMKFSVTGPLTPEQVRGFLDRCLCKYKERGYWLWAAIYRPENRLIGYSGLLDQYIDNKPEIEVAYRLAPAFWGRGLGTEAAALARDYAFARLGTDRVISLIEPANMASIRVAEKNGFTYEKDTTYYHLFVRVYSLWRSQWLRLPHILSPQNQVCPEPKRGSD